MSLALSIIGWILIVWFSLGVLVNLFANTEPRKLNHLQIVRGRVFRTVMYLATIFVILMAHIL